MKILSVQNIQSNWNFIKVLKIGLALMVIVQSIQSHDATLGIFGSLFMMQAFLNIGCCGPNGCAVDATKKESGKIEDIQFVEVKPTENIK
jgi:hypothetical protein